MSSTSNVTLRYEDYRIPLVIASTTLGIIGISAHLFIIYCSEKILYKKLDYKSFLLLMQLHSFFAAMGLFCGAAVSTRHEFFEDRFIFICYGLAGYLKSGGVCAVLDMFPSQYVSFSSIMIPTLTVFRALTIYEKKFSKTAVCTVVAVIFLATSPAMIAVAYSYAPIEDIRKELTPSLSLETMSVPSWAYKFNSTIAQMFILFNYASSVSVFISIMATAVIFRKVAQLVNSLSRQTIKLHRAYILILSLDITFVLIYIIATQKRWVTLPHQLDFFISLFNFCIFCLPALLQGVLTIMIVPYLRRGLKEMLVVKRTVTVVNSAVDSVQSIPARA